MMLLSGVTRVSYKCYGILCSHDEYSFRGGSKHATSHNPVSPVGRRLALHRVPICGDRVNITFQ